VALEINAQPDRTDLNDANARLAAERGTWISLGTDAHATTQLDFLRFGVFTARRAWLTAADVLNTLPLDRFRAALRNPKGKSVVVHGKPPKQAAARKRAAAGDAKPPAAPKKAAAAGKTKPPAAAKPKAVAGRAEAAVPARRPAAPRKRPVKAAPARKAAPGTKRAAKPRGKASPGKPAKRPARRK
jgi:hypothetical protein